MGWLQNTGIVAVLAASASSAYAQNPISLCIDRSDKNPPDQSLYFSLKTPIYKYQLLPNLIEEKSNDRSSLCACLMYASGTTLLLSENIAKPEVRNYIIIAKIIDEEKSRTKKDSLPQITVTYAPSTHDPKDLRRYMSMPGKPNLTPKKLACTSIIKKPIDVNVPPLPDDSSSIYSVP